MSLFYRISGHHTVKKVMPSDQNNNSSIENEHDDEAQVPGKRYTLW